MSNDNVNSNTKNPQCITAIEWAARKWRLAKVCTTAELRPGDYFEVSVGTAVGATNRCPVYFVEEVKQQNNTMGQIKYTHYKSSLRRLDSGRNWFVNFPGGRCSVFELVPKAWHEV